MDLTGVPSERYSINDRVHLSMDRLPPSAYVGKTLFQEICHLFHVSPYIPPTEIPNGLSHNALRSSKKPLLHCTVL
jgi:hypothetical protein